MCEECVRKSEWRWCVRWSVTTTESVMQQLTCCVLWCRWSFQCIHCCLMFCILATIIVLHTQCTFCRWPGTLLPNCCKTSSGIRIPSMALQFMRAADKIVWGCSTPCSADYSLVGNTPYAESCCMLGIQSLADRRLELCRTLFKQTVNNELHSLHYLLPAKRDTRQISRLRSTAVYQTFHVQTNRFKNLFSLYCLSNYQWQSLRSVLLLTVCLCVCLYMCECFNPAFGCQNTINVML